mgnify:CR=1 FL=1
MTTNILNRTTAPQVIRFFDICFKQGVFDAYNLGDDLEAKAFLEERSEDWKFGILGEADDYDWQAFRFTLYWWARKYHMTGLAENYIFKIQTKNYLWCLLPYCMRFYLMGIDEWECYPNPVNIEVFKGQNKVHWDPSADVNKFTTQDYIYHMQDFAHKYRRLPEDYPYPVSPGVMDEYCKAIYDLTRKYVR